MSPKHLIALYLLASPAAHAWDKHQTLTRAALANESSLDESVQVSAIETYLKKTFGERCTVAKARDAVFDGIGRDFEFFYQSNVGATFTTDWETATNILHLDPQSFWFESDPQRIGGRVAARDVLATYVDEPDWKLDDDVPRLASAGAVEGAKSGTATRALRHFWTPTEEVMGIRLGVGQETDARMQLYYQLAMLAFDEGDSYWGYRFLGNATHYLQDMAQPYHVVLIINTDMLDMPTALHTLTCDVDRQLSKRFPLTGAPRCKGNETLSRAVIDSAWYVGTYHAVYEEFALAMLRENGFATREFIAQDASDGLPITWRTVEGGLLDLKSVIRQAQQQVVPHAQAAGEETVATFGRRYVKNQKVCESTLASMGQDRSREYELGSRYYVADPTMATPSEFKHRTKLVALINAQLRTGATWTRQFVREALSPRSSQAKAEIAAFKKQLAARCNAP